MQSMVVPMCMLHGSEARGSEARGSSALSNYKQKQAHVSTRYGQAPKAYMH